MISNFCIVTHCCIICHVDECQSTFVSCSEIIVSASFEHSDGIMNENMLYVLYTMSESLRGQLKRGIGTTVLYIGKQARSATFVFTFDGVPSAIMSTSQVEYFQDFTKSFASNAVSESIYEIVVQKQEIVDGSLVVTGQFLGADEGGGAVPQGFTDNIANALRNKNTDYVQGLAYNVLRPTSTLDKIDAGYFQDITAFKLDMEAIIQTLAPTPAPVAPGVIAPTSDGAGNTVGNLTKAASDANGSMLVIIGVIGVICVCIAILVLYICCKWNRKDVLDFDKNQTSTYPDLNDDDDNASLDKKKISSDSSSEFSAEKKPSMTRSASSRQPSSSSLGKSPPLPINGLQRGQSMSVISQNTGPPKLGRSKSGDGLPRPSRNADFKKSHSSDGLGSSISRLPSLSEEERPKRRPNSSSAPSVPLSRSISGDQIQRPAPIPNLQRSKSGDGIPRPLPLVPPSPTTSEGKQIVSSRIPPKRENSMGGMRPPAPSKTESGSDRSDSRNVADMIPFSPKARAPPMRAQSMNPNAAARNNQMNSNGPQPPRKMSSEQMQSLPAQSSGTPNHRPSPPQRAPSLPVQRASHANGQPPSTPTRDRANTPSQSSSTPPQRQHQQQRPVPPPRVPSPRRPETGSNNNGVTPMPVPSTPKRDQEMRTTPRTPSNGTPKRQMPPQQHQQARPRSPQRTISLPSTNLPPNRPMVAPPIKEKMSSGDRASPDVIMSSPMRTKSMPVKPIPNPSTGTTSTGNPTNTSKQLSPIT
jgi:hypothetical protein